MLIREGSSVQRGSVRGRRVSAVHNIRENPVNFPFVYVLWFLTYVHQAGSLIVVLSKLNSAIEIWVFYYLKTVIYCLDICVIILNQIKSGLLLSY